MAIAFKESVADRTRHTKLFDGDDGRTQRLVSSLGRLHLKRGGLWLNHDTRLDDGGRVRLAAYDMELYKDKIGYHGYDPISKDVELEMFDLPYVEPEIQNITWKLADTEEEFGYSIVTYRDVAQDTDIVLTFQPLGISCVFVKKTSQAPDVRRYRIFRQSGALGQLRNRGVDDNQRKTHITIDKQDTGREGEQIVTQTFLREVRVINPTTRVASWSQDVSWPVLEDPTSTFLIGANADDGVGRGWGTFTPAPPPWPNTSVRTAYNFESIFWMQILPTTLFAKRGAYLRFNVTGIPQSSTIVLATLRAYGFFNPFGGIPFTMDIQATNQADPGVPTTASVIMTPPSPVGTATTVWTTTGSVASKPSFVAHDISVTAQIQTLVNAFPFTSAHMRFALNRGAPYPGAVPGPMNAIYMRDWGLSRAAKLVIEFLDPFTGGKVLPRFMGGAYG